MGKKQRHNEKHNYATIILLGYFYCFNLIGCSGLTGGLDSIPASPIRVEMYGTKFSCRDYLVQKQIEPLYYGLYSYILLTSRYGNKREFERYLKLYEAYLTLDQKELYDKQGIPMKNINITYWPVKALPDKNSDYNIFFVENYDYVRADILLRSIFTSIKNPGPFIIASHFPLSYLEGFIQAGIGNGEFLILDLSRIDEDLFLDVLRYFRDKVTSDPKTWQNGFDWQYIRISMYSALKLHGEPVLYAADWVNGKFKIGKAFAAP